MEDVIRVLLANKLQKKPVDNYSDDKSFSVEDRREKKGFSNKNVSEIKCHYCVLEEGSHGKRLLELQEAETRGSIVDISRCNDPIKGVLLRLPCCRFQHQRVL